jgi:hypothetical protein
MTWMQISLAKPLEHRDIDAMRAGNREDKKKQMENIRRYQNSFAVHLAHFPSTYIR